MWTSDVVDPEDRSRSDGGGGGGGETTPELAVGWILCGGDGV